jgi:hypothetical protein
MTKEYDFSTGKRGAVLPVPSLLDWFRDQVHKADGGNYQSLINHALRDFMDRSREPLESRRAG